MDEIYPNLFISNYPEMNRMSAKKRSKYSKIFVAWPWEIEENTEAAWSRYKREPWTIPECDFNICFSDPDGKVSDYIDLEKLDVAADYIRDRLDSGDKVICFCMAGMERSPTAIMRYLNKHRGMSIGDSEGVMRAHHPETANHSTMRVWLAKIDKLGAKSDPEMYMGDVV